LTEGCRIWLAGLIIGFVFIQTPVSAQTGVPVGNCPNDQDIVIVLARAHVKLIAPDQQKSIDPTGRTWAAQAVKKPYRIEMQFGQGVPDLQIPDELKGKQVVLFFDCAQNDREDRREGFWSHEEVLQPSDGTDGFTFKIGKLGVTILRDPDMLIRLSKYEGRKVLIGLMCPQNKLTKRLFNDGAAPKAVLFSSKQSKK
jgi:hypothetical protein